jgi:peptide/nickel transport system substrate-binding protein
MRQIIWFFLVVILTLSNTGFSQEQAEEVNPQFGGTLIVALAAEPEMLDIHLTTSEVTAIIAHHWLETLVAFDANWVPQPFLAEEVDVSPDATQYTFHLRRGVLFHNGKEMKAEDVVASLNRWMQTSVRAASAASLLEGIRAVDDYTVEVVMTEPFAPLLSLLSYTTGGAVIYPMEVVEESGDQPIRDHVGTGPFRFVEWAPDRFVRVERFDEYQPPDGPADGAAGSRVAYVDEIRFVSVPEAATRIAGVQTGEHHYGAAIPTDLYASLEADARVETVIIRPSRWPIFLLNKREGSMTDKTLRHAINAALNMEQLLIAAAGPSEFWELNHNYMVGDTPWRTEAGSERYNLGDPDLARQLAEEAGYDGEPIRWLVAGERHEHFVVTQAAIAQLERAGFNVDLQAVEWATLLDRRANPELWDVFTTTGAFIPDPVLLTVITERYPGWWEDDRREELSTRLNAAPTLEERQAVWEEFHAYIYEEMPSIFVGETYDLAITTPNLQGYEVFDNKPFFWNVWLE